MPPACPREVTVSVYNPTPDNPAYMGFRPHTDFPGLDEIKPGRAWATNFIGNLHTRLIDHMRKNEFTGTVNVVFEQDPSQNFVLSLTSESKNTLVRVFENTQLIRGEKIFDGIGRFHPCKELPGIEKHTIDPKPHNAIAWVAECMERARFYGTAKIVYEDGRFKGEQRRVTLANPGMPK